MIKNLPAMPETWIQSLGGEGTLERRTTTFSCFLAWRIPWTEEPDSQWDGITNSRIQVSNFHFHFFRTLSALYIQIHCISNVLFTVSSKLSSRAEQVKY